MAGRMARENANDAEAQAVPETGYLGRLVTHVLNAAQGIPGMEAFEAGAGALGSHLTSHPLSYQESLNTLRDQTGNIGGKTSVAEKAMGGLATLPFLPANPAAAGALLGGADQALNADPNQSLLERGTRTAAGAAGGALVGRYLDKAITAGSSLLRPTAAADVIGMKAARAQSAKEMYDLALNLGHSHEATQAVKDYVAEPEIADIVSELQKTKQFANVAPHDPAMLDAIYKTLSDRAAIVKKGLESVTPNRPNIGRFRGKDIASQQQGLLSALEAPGTKTTTTVIPAMETAQSPAPSLRDALRNFTDRATAAYTRTQGTIDQQARGRRSNAMLPKALSDH
jgi:hypothetical protein